MTICRKLMAREITLLPKPWKPMLPNREPPFHPLGIITEPRTYQSPWIQGQNAIGSNRAKGRGGPDLPWMYDRELGPWPPCVSLLDMGGHWQVLPCKVDLGTHMSQGLVHKGCWTTARHSHLWEWCKYLGLRGKQIFTEQEIDIFFFIFNCVI